MFSLIPLVPGLELNESFEKMELSFECVSDRKSKLRLLDKVRLGEKLLILNISASADESSGLEREV